MTTTETHRPEIIAADVAGQWLDTAFHNRRDDLFQLLSDMDDDPGSVIYEFLDVAHDQGVPDEELEIDDPVHDAIVESANDMLYEAPRHFIGKLLGEAGPEAIWDLPLPEPIRSKILEIRDGSETDAGVIRLVLAVVLDAVDRRTQPVSG